MLGRWIASCERFKWKEIPVAKSSKMMEASNFIKFALGLKRHKGRRKGSRQPQMPPSRLYAML